MMYVRPAPDCIIRMPDTFEIMPPGGVEVPRDAFWVRRVRDGDVIEGAPAGDGLAHEPEHTVDEGSAA